MGVVRGQRESVTSSDGVEIGMITEGVGPRLLLVHGGMSSSTRWEPVWPLLTRNRRVTAMDRRGRGMSGDAARYGIAQEYDDVLAAAQHLAVGEPEGIDVFAHSIGAVCALGAAGRGAPIRRLALYEPPGPRTVSREWIDRVTAWVAAGQAGRAMRSFLVEIIGMDATMVTAMRDSPVAAESNPIATATMAREAEALLALDLADVTRGVTAPMLFLLGGLSPRWARTITHELHQALSRATVAELPSHGHEALDTAPDLVVAELERFFRAS